MATIAKSAKKLFKRHSYSILDLLYHLHSDDDDNLRKQAKTLLNYTIKKYPHSLIYKLLETIRESPSSSIRCYHFLRDVLPPLWTNLSSTTRNDLKIDLNYQIWVEEDYETLKACSSCVSILASFLFPKLEWDTLFDDMLHNLGSNSWNRKMGALLLLYELIPKCPEVFEPYIDTLIVEFRNCKSRILGDHRCQVVAAKACVELILYLSTPASYYKFYVLFGYVKIIFSVALGEEELVCSFLEDLIVLAREKTAFFNDRFGVVAESMMELADNVELEEKLRKLSIEFIVTVAEDKKSGCGMMQMVPKELVTKLLSVLMLMLIYIEDDPSWRNATTDDENEGELSMCSFAMESLHRLAIAIGGNVIVPSLPPSLFNYLDDKDWQIRHAAVTAIGVLSEGCSGAIEVFPKDIEQIVETIIKLICDNHPRVRWATIHAIGQISRHLSPAFQQQHHQKVLPALIKVLDEFHNPRLQTRATSTILWFGLYCSADILKPYLRIIVCKLVGFLQSGRTMMKEAALETLAALVFPSKEDAGYIYNSIMPHMKIILVTADDDTNRTLLDKFLKYITMIKTAVQNIETVEYVEKVTAALISLQKTHMEEEDPVRCLLLKVWGGLCRCVGVDFTLYLSSAMPIVLKSATLKNYLSVPENSDDESMFNVTVGNKKIGTSSPILKEKALACQTICCFATELKEGLHSWVNEVVSALVPNLTFEISEDVRMAAIAAMPLLLNSAACATKKGLPVTGGGKSPVQTISDTIISALLDALKKESKVQIQAKLLEAFNESIQIPGSRLSKHQAEEFVDSISKVLSTCSYHKTKREKRETEHKDQREQELLKEEAEQHLSICRNIGICLGTMVEKLKASFLPLFDKFLPYVSLMWSNDRTAEERRILVHLFGVIAEQCREEVFWHYEEWIPRLPRVYYHKNPDVPQIIVTAIGICAELGADFLEPKTPVMFRLLKTLMEHPDAKRADNIMAYEAAVCTCGKLNQFASEAIPTYELNLLWLNHLPIRRNLDEAKISHELLCSMMERRVQKVIGPDGSYTPIIIAIFTEVLSAGSTLATEETRKQIINLFKKFQREMEPTVWSIIFETLPQPHQKMLRTVLSNV